MGLSSAEGRIGSREKQRRASVGGPPGQPERQGLHGEHRHLWTRGPLSQTEGHRGGGSCGDSPSLMPLQMLGPSLVLWPPPNHRAAGLPYVVALQFLIHLSSEPNHLWVSVFLTDSYLGGDGVKTGVQCGKRNWAQGLTVAHLPF